MLGSLIAREMLKNQSTQNAIKAMRAEIVEFLKTHPNAAARLKKLPKEAGEKKTAKK
jgi:hypothetical protein